MSSRKKRRRNRKPSAAGLTGEDGEGSANVSSGRDGGNEAADEVRTPHTFFYFILFHSGRVARKWRPVSASHHALLNNFDVLQHHEVGGTSRQATA